VAPVLLSGEPSTFSNAIASERTRCARVSIAEHLVSQLRDTLADNHTGRVLSLVHAALDKLRQVQGQLNFLTSERSQFICVLQLTLKAIAAQLQALITLHENSEL
jgi:hypothetical protein